MVAGAGMAGTGKGHRQQHDDGWRISHWKMRPGLPWYRPTPDDSGRAEKGPTTLIYE